MRNTGVLGVRVDALTKEGLQEALKDMVRRREKGVVAYVNVHAINLAQDDPKFREFLNKAKLVYCDGEGVRLGARMLGIDLPPRIVLTYWIWELCAMCERENMSVFFLGGEPETVELAVKNLQTKFARLNVAGWHHGFFGKWNEESETVVKRINHANPDLLFVGFGMPLQEQWIDANFDKLQVRAILPAGSMIDYTAGKKSFAPSWMADNGMEWLYRLLQEPGRLWRRYIIGNPAFLFRILVQSSKQKVA